MKSTVCRSLFEYSIRRRISGSVQLTREKNDDAYKLDPKKLKALPAGSFHTEPANVNHFTMTKEGGVVVQITGTGPTGFKYVDPAHAPKKK